MAEVKQYENNGSDPNSLHVHVFRCDPESKQLYCDISWDLLHERSWTRRPFVRAQEVQSVDVALETAQQIAEKNAIPLIRLENHAA